MRKIIAVDFDGTLCENKWPDIGDPNLELIAYLKKEKKNGARLILWTCRMGERLDKAVVWCKKHKLTFNAVNKNLKESIKAFGGDSRKIFAHEYIDDRFNPHFELPFKPVAYEMKCGNPNSDYSMQEALYRKALFAMQSGTPITKKGE